MQARHQQADRSHALGHFDRFADQAIKTIAFLFNDDQQLIFLIGAQFQWKVPEPSTACRNLFTGL